MFSRKILQKFKNILVVVFLILVYVVISPIAENHVNDASANDIVNKSIPSIHRSLRWTPRD